MSEQTTHHNWSHLNCLRSCPHHHSACHSRDKHDYSDSGNFWWVGTGSFLNDRKEGVYSLSSPCINKYFPYITNKTLPMYCKHLLGKLIIFIFLQFNCMCVYEKKTLTALLRVLIRVISTVILPITLPGQWLTQSVITLELLMGAVPCH